MLRSSRGEDLYGTLALRNFLKGYRRITVEDACSERKIDHSQLDVWVNRAGVWTQDRNVSKMWGKRDKQSLCRDLVTGLFGLSHDQYEAMRDGLDDTKSTGLMGIYKNDSTGRFVVTLRLPRDNRLRFGAVGAGALATGVLGKMVVDKYTKSPQPQAEPLVAKLPWMDAMNALLLAAQQVENFFHDAKIQGIKQFTIITGEDRAYANSKGVTSAVLAGASIHVYGLADTLHDKESVRVITHLTQPTLVISDTIPQSSDWLLWGPKVIPRETPSDLTKKIDSVIPPPEKLMSTYAMIYDRSKNNIPSSFSANVITSKELTRKDHHLFMPMQHFEVTVQGPAHTLKQIQSSENVMNFVVVSTPTVINPYTLFDKIQALQHDLFLYSAKKNEKEAQAITSKANEFATFFKDVARILEHKESPDKSVKELSEFLDIVDNKLHSVILEKSKFIVAQNEIIQNPAK